MTTPMINPSVLTSEQKEAVRAEWEYAKEAAYCGNPYLHGRFAMLQDLFGREFFTGQEAGGTPRHEDKVDNPGKTEQKKPNRYERD